jgi:hypothetical protein
MLNLQEYSDRNCFLILQSQSAAQSQLFPTHHQAPAHPPEANPFRRVNRRESWRKGHSHRRDLDCL